MTTADYRRIITAPTRESIALFLVAANRPGAPVGHVEMDFWVC